MGHRTKYSKRDRKSINFREKFCWFHWSQYFNKQEQMWCFTEKYPPQYFMETENTTAILWLQGAAASTLSCQNICPPGLLGPCRSSPVPLTAQLPAAVWILAPCQQQDNCIISRYINLKVLKNYKGKCDEFDYIRTNKIKRNTISWEESIAFKLFFLIKRKNCSVEKAAK